MTFTAAAMPRSSPADLYGDLLAEVQMRALFGDGKTFVDAMPRLPAADIVAAFRDVPRHDATVADFVRTWFDLPAAAEVPDARVGRPLRHHIHTLWSELARGPDDAMLAGSALPLRHRYLVPGGRFRELYYWDSFFSMLGLVRDGHRELAEQMLDGFTDLIKRYGHVPNGSRSYYIGRSQPPFYAAMVELLPHPDPMVMRRRLAAMEIEHSFWMAGANGLPPGLSRARVVAMRDGAILNRHWDERDTPRDESFREDVSTASAAPGRDPAGVYRDIRAAAESGWDFSSRWFDENAGLESIRTTCIVPIDLNAFLYRLEGTIARVARDLFEHARAARFRDLARRRRRAIVDHLWSPELGVFVDYDHERGHRRHQVTAAALTPLFVGLASPAQGASTAHMVEARLLGPGGLRTTTIETGEQWDWPNGWAPLQWMGFAGLDRYGHSRLAGEIAGRWSGMVGTEFDRTAWLHEKYDIERRTAGGGGEYVPQHGFGWTNGVTAAFMDLAGVGSSSFDRADAARLDPPAIPAGFGLEGHLR
ncbi:alpha,alpha-trehalase TreF [Sphingomonas sp. LB2R24]|uniref:alpha,alpha-trehalase TreF n=1 Tax=Sphingomonas sorbitolis TaxID=3096165 RepID=UPI002FCC95E2